MKTYQSYPLITIQSNKSYRINQSAIQYLLTLPQDDQYSVVTIVGKSKTGKSFLMNQLLQDNRMFPINNSIGGGGNGIMLSTKLLEINGMKIIILDSQGYGGLQGSDDRDCKFLILNLLLSSVIVYNSMGTIDQQTLNSFSMIIEIGKIFEKQLQAQNSLPALLWTLRDFSLRMQDKTGFPITPKQYLQSALQQQKGNSQSIFHKNRIRRVIKSLFSQRNCQTLVLPTQQLPSSINFSDCQLREQFVQDLKRLKSKLGQMIQRKGCKYMNGKKMSISMFINALRIYVKCLNRSMMQGSLPKIQNITFQLRQSQAKGCKQKFYVFLQQKKRDIIEQISDLLKSKDKIEDLQHIKNKFLQPVQKLYETTRNNIYQLTGEFQLQELSELKANFYDELQRQCSQVLKKCHEISSDSQEIQNICEFISHIANEQQLDQEYNTQIHNLRQKNLGKDKTIFANILMKVQIAYLRRKLQLSKQINLKIQKQSLELQFTKKQLHTVQSRNKELQSQLISQIRDSRKSFLTPIKPQNIQQKAFRSSTKQPGLIRTIHNDSLKKQFSNQKHLISASKVQSSSFYVPYVNIQKPQYLVAKIVRTLIKQDSKRNNYIQYVIDISLLGQKWMVNRKFKDFTQLHSILVMMFQNLSLPDCKVILGPLNQSDFNGSKKQTVQQRRRQLQSYIKELIDIENVRNSRILQKFFKINKQYTIL